MMIELPFPPSLNTYYRTFMGRILISKDGREYRKRVAQLMFLDRARESHGRLAVEIRAYPPDKRRRDLDNMMKAALDALTHAGAWGDDSQIDDLRIVRCATDKDEPRIEIIVTELGG